MSRCILGEVNQGNTWSEHITFPLFPLFDSFALQKFFFFHTRAMATGEHAGLLKYNACFNIYKRAALAVFTWYALCTSWEKQNL